MDTLRMNSELPLLHFLKKLWRSQRSCFSKHLKEQVISVRITGKIELNHSGKIFGQSLAIWLLRELLTLLQSWLLLLEESFSML